MSASLSRLRHRAHHREPADELGDEPELDQVLGQDVAQDLAVTRLGAPADLGPEADALAADPALDDLVEPGEGPAADEQDVGRVDLDEFLMGVLAAALGRHRRGRPLQDLEQRLLHTLARHVTGDRRVLALAGDLVDLVDVDDPGLGPLHVVVGRLDQLDAGHDHRSGGALALLHDVVKVFDLLLGAPDRVPEPAVVGVVIARRGRALGSLDRFAQLCDLLLEPIDDVGQSVDAVVQLIEGTRPGIVIEQSRRQILRPLRRQPFLDQPLAHVPAQLVVRLASVLRVAHGRPGSQSTPPPSLPLAPIPCSCERQAAGTGYHTPRLATARPEHVHNRRRYEDSPMRRPRPGSDTAFLTRHVTRSTPCTTARS